MSKTISDIQIDSELSWVTPYLRRVQNIVDFSKVKTINSTKYDPRVNRGSYAFCKKRPSRQIFDIYLDKFYQWHTHHHDGTWSVKIKNHSKIDLLCLLAHELAHVVVWEDEHSPRHKIIEARITASFMKLLDKEGYISEEDELQTKELV